MVLKDDKKRYNWLVRLHAVCTLAFVTRFILICADLSAATNDAIRFPIIILILELGSSFITFMSNIFYVSLRYIGSLLFESDQEKVFCCSQSFAWSLSTLTCVRCHCYQEHPQCVLITRFLILCLFEVMRFTSFVLACYCANRYGPIGLGYAIVAAFSFLPAIPLLIVEFLHYHRLWFNYRPDSKSDATTTLNPRHRGFLPLELTNDHQTSHWQRSKCAKGNECESRNLYHVIMYHSANRRYPPDKTTNGQIVIGFHQTSHRAAYGIARQNFLRSKIGWIGPGIYFATSLNHTEFKANQFGTYICAQVDLGRTVRITNPTDWETKLNEYDTMYYEHPDKADEFCVLQPEQIRSWVIVVNQNSNLGLIAAKHNEPISPGKYFEDYLEENVYRGCVFNI